MQQKDIMQILEFISRSQESVESFKCVVLLQLTKVIINRKGSFIKDVRKRGGRGVKQNWTSTFGSNLISI